METIIVHPKNQKQLATIEAILKALEVSFEKEKKSPYDPAFVAKIKESKKQAEEGKIVSYTIAQLEELCK